MISKKRTLALLIAFVPYASYSFFVKGITNLYKIIWESKRRRMELRIYIRSIS